MAEKNESLKMAIVQMVELGEEFLYQQMSNFSKLNQCSNWDARHELEKLYLNEITATANVIRLFTGREVSFQIERGANGELNGGFALYEIMQDVPCYKIPCGVSLTHHSRYSGKQEEDRRIDWGKGIEQGKIVKIYELIYDKNANPCYIGGYQVSEFQTA
jgi:hypothetical protein